MFLTAGTDYVAVTYNLLIQPSMLRTCVLVYILDDSVAETVEDFFVMIESNSRDVSIGPAIAEICIVDDDGK